ncbi:MAG: hypothetical protein ACRECW_20455 [Phyllobacterium sp.]
MKPDFHSIIFDKIGAATTNQNIMWGSLSLTFSDDVLQVNPMVELVVPLSKSNDTTLAMLQVQAREQALAVLKEAVAILEQHEIAHLETMSLS